MVLGEVSCVASGTERRPWHLIFVAMSNKSTTHNKERAEGAREAGGQEEGSTCLSVSRISRLNPASIKSCEEALIVFSMTLLYTLA